MMCLPHTVSERARIEQRDMYDRGGGVPREGPTSKFSMSGVASTYALNNWTHSRAYTACPVHEKKRDK